MHARTSAACNPDGVLSSMRDRRGNPNWAIRALALVVALMLLGPGLVVLLLRAVDSFFSVV